MKLMKNKKGQTDSVFKLALVVIIIAAVLAVVAYMMNSAWGGAQDIATGAATVTETVETSANCLVTGDCEDVGPGG
jgi:uncharacterized protein (UPF0333 family)